MFTEYFSAEEFISDNEKTDAYRHPFFFYTYYLLIKTTTCTAVIYKLNLKNKH